MSTKLPKDDDEVLGDAQGLPALVPDGEYKGVFKRVEQGPYRGRPRYFLWFAIAEPGPFLNVELFLSCPFPKVMGRPFSQSSNLYKAYSIAIGGTPQRKDRMSTRAFKGKMFRFSTRTVDTDDDGEPKKLAERYSVIGKLIKIETGKKVEAGE